MAVVRIETNVPAFNINEAFFVESTESLASTFRKPKSDILIFINSDQPIIFGGSQDAAVIISILSSDAINETDNKLHSAALFSLITKHLKVNHDRISIAFTPVDKSDMGCNGKTFIQ